ncbi:DUF6387 family protein [Leclercia sp. G3L]|uniref:DUF6387 family protein n=1 Tax=Leclercia sp. G3L TaxID=2898725 RepID=UPI001E578315|nr:DUF6387 family protein [Leclercia sp. G3L]UGB04197.1 DUF6387 family protein [Leclercia sp. G3L]
MNIDFKKVVETLVKSLLQTDIDFEELKQKHGITIPKVNEISDFDLKNIRVNSKKNLPDGFKLEKYDALETLTDEELLYQLEKRLTLKREVDESIGYCKGTHPELLSDTDGIISLMFLLMKNRRKVNDLLEKPLEIVRFDQSNDESRSSFYGSSAQGIEPIRRISVDNIRRTDSLHGEWVGTKVIESSEVQLEWLERDEEGYDNYLWESVSHISELKKEGEMWIAVDLYQNDEVLITNFAKLLDKWRSELGVELKKPSIGSWDITKRKIIEYKIIPMIDLELWASMSAKKINHGVLAVALFPLGDGNMDSFKIAQTVKPFIGKVLNKNSLEKIRWEISKETNT